MADENIKTTLQFNADITDFKGAMSEARNAIKLANSQFNEASSSMDDWGKSTDGLKAKLQQLANVEAAQKRQLAVLENAYEQVVAEQGEASAEAVKLKTQIHNQQAAVNKTHKSFEKYSDELDNTGKELREVDGAAKEAKEGIGALDKVAEGVKNTLAAVATAVAGVVTAFFASAESTREYRKEMAQLTQNAADAGQDVGKMKEVLADVSAVTGEADAAMEGLNMLMATGLNTDDLEAAAEAFAGAATKFDGLKFEGMAEGLQESLATGAAVGPFAELIERAGGNLENFNAGLSKCTDEASRQQYVMQWLAESGLQDVHDAYVQNNSDLVEAERAQFRLNDAMAAIGAIAEPVMSSLKNLAAGLLETITPFVSLIGEGLTMAISGASGAASTLAEGINGLFGSLVGKITEVMPMLLSVVSTVLPSVISSIGAALPSVVEAILGVVPQLTEALVGALPLLLETILNIVTQVISSLSDMLPGIITAVVAIIPQLVTAFTENMPVLLQAAIELFAALVDAIPVVVEQLTAMLPIVIATLVQFFNDNFDMVLDATIALLMSLVEAIPVIIDALVDELPSIIKTLVSFCADNAAKVAEAAVELLMQIVDAIPEIIDALVDALPEIITAIVTALVNATPKLLEVAIDLFFSLLEAGGKLLAELPDLVFGIIRALVDGMIGGLGSIGSAAGKIVSTIWEAIKALPGKLLDVGKNLVSGLWEGISNNFTWIKNKISGWVGNVLDFIKGLFGIHSPSAVMRDEIGKMLGLGMAEGIEKSRNAVNAAVRDLGSAAMSGLAGTIDAGGYAAGGGKTIIINQTNNSPRALSRLEIYRQTHNALAYAGGM